MRCISVLLALMHTGAVVGYIILGACKLEVETSYSSHYICSLSRHQPAVPDTTSGDICPCSPFAVVPAPTFARAQHNPLRLDIFFFSNSPKVP